MQRAIEVGPRNWNEARLWTVLALLAPIGLLAFHIAWRRTDLASHACSALVTLALIGASGLSLHAASQAAWPDAGDLEVAIGAPGGMMWGLVGGGMVLVALVELLGTGVLALFRLFRRPEAQSPT